MARAVSQGIKGGVVAAVGLAVGSMVHVTATVLGLSTIFSHSPALFMIIKLAGAVYLIYLGVKYLRFKGTADGFETTKVKPLVTVFKESNVVEVKNPKTAMFFLALLPQFVVPESGPVWLQLLILGLIVTVSAVPCDVLVAVFSSKVSNWLLQHQRAQWIQELVSGSILFGLGACIAGVEIYSLLKEP